MSRTHSTLLKWPYMKCSASNMCTEGYQIPLDLRFITYYVRVRVDLATDAVLEMSSLITLTSGDTGIVTALVY